MTNADYPAGKIVLQMVRGEKKAKAKPSDGGAVLAL